MSAATKRLETRTLTHEAWVAQGERLFGKDKMQWKFVCPICKHVATAADWQRAGAPEGAIAYSCIGRWTADPYKAFGANPKDKVKGPCNYTNGGLFNVSSLRVADLDGNEHTLFEFDVVSTEGAA